MDKIIYFAWSRKDYKAKGNKSIFSMSSFKSSLIAESWITFALRNVGALIIIKILYYDCDLPKKIYANSCFSVRTSLNQVKRCTERNRLNKQP